MSATDKAFCAVMHHIRTQQQDDNEVSESCQKVGRPFFIGQNIEELWKKKKPNPK